MLNVCSVSGLVGMPKVTAYCTSKFGMVGFSESLRNEFGREGLGVTALCPGFVRTNLFTSAPLEAKVEEHKIPPKIITTTPERVANAAVKAIYRNRRLVVMEPFARFMYAMKRFAPWLMDAIFHMGRRKRVARKMAELKKPRNIHSDYLVGIFPTHSSSDCLASNHTSRHYSRLPFNRIVLSPFALRDAIRPIFFQPRPVIGVRHLATSLAGRRVREWRLWK